MLKDLEVNRQARECPYTVTFMGALCREGEVLICMELMETSLHQYYTDAHKFQLGMPEPVLGKHIYSAAWICSSNASPVEYY